VDEELETFLKGARRVIFAGIVGDREVPGVTWEVGSALLYNVHTLVVASRSTWLLWSGEGLG